ncbi:MAG TPA: methyltransferase domain-containing protein [Pirellulales bacterium]|nr:methyltransferase domain-containing protein [Pirellulales bacterium]
MGLKQWIGRQLGVSRCRRVALGERRAYPFPAGWIRVDWRDADFNIDLVRSPKLPFRSQSKDLIYSAHLIEHLPHETLLELLRECYRVLRPGGHIRLECPDAEKLFNLYRSADRHMLDHFRKFRKEVLVAQLGYSEEYLDDRFSLLGELANYPIGERGWHAPPFASRDEFDEKLNHLELDDFARWCASLLTTEQRASGGHQNAIYPKKLAHALTQVGFCDIKQQSFGETGIPSLKLNDGPESIIEKPHRQFYSLYMEATRPADAVR